jgi:hypothetical protein
VATVFGYWKISDNDGVGLVGSSGVQRDNNTDSFDFSGNAGVEGTFGIYRDWMLKIGGSFFDTRVSTGAFHAYVIQIALTRRF